MLGLVIVFVSAFAVISGGLVIEKPWYDVNNQELCRQLFEDFIKTYNKVYKSAEKEYRFEIFIQNLETINKHNRESDTSVHDVNKFSDLTQEEFIKMYTGFVPNCSNVSSEVPDVSGVSPSESFDWDKDKHAVTKVKDQGTCGSCWAFSTIANVESQYAIKHGKLIELSEQQLVSCDKDSSCASGGEIYQGLCQLISMGGVETEQDYPYTSGAAGKEGPCKFNKSKAKVKVKSGKSIALSKMSEDDLKALLFKYGPISIAVDAGALSSYHGGIDKNCGGRNLDHAVLLVGYGVDNGTPFWRIKNSWGENWANEGGYFRILRGENCFGLMNNYAAIGTIE